MDYAAIAAASLASRRRKPANTEKILQKTPPPSSSEEVFVPAQHPLAAPAVMVDPTQLPDVITWNLPRECKRIYVVFSGNAYSAAKMLIQKIVYQDPANRYLFGMQYAKPDAPTGSDASIPNAALVVDGSAWGQLSKQSPHMVVWQLFCGRQDLSLLEMPAIVVVGMPFACDTRCLVGSSKGKKTAFIDSEARMLTVMASCAPYVSPVFESSIVYKAIYNASNPCTSCGMDLLSGELTAATCCQGHTACAACVVKADKTCPAKVFSGKGLESSHRCAAKMISVSPGTPKRIALNTSRGGEEEEEEAGPPPILAPAPVPIAQRQQPIAAPIARDADGEDAPPPLLLDWDAIQDQMKTFAPPVQPEPEPEPEPEPMQVEEEEDEEEEEEEEEPRRSRRKRDARNSLFNLPDPERLGRSVNSKPKKRPAHIHMREEEEEEEEEEDEFDTGYSLRNSTAQAKVENQFKPKPKRRRRRKKKKKVVEEEEPEEEEGGDAPEDPAQGQAVVEMDIVPPPSSYWDDALSLFGADEKFMPALFGDQAHVLKPTFIPLPFDEETPLPLYPVNQMLQGF